MFAFSKSETYGQCMLILNVYLQYCDFS